MYKNIWITWLESYETLWRDSTVCLWGWNKIIKITTTKSPRDFIHTGRNLCFSCTPNLKLSSSLTFASGAISVRLLIVVGLICINMHKSSFTFTHALHLNHYTWTNKLKTSFTCFHTKCRFVLCFFFQVLTLQISTRPCLFVCFFQKTTLPSYQSCLCIHLLHGIWTQIMHHANFFICPILARAAEIIVSLGNHFKNVCKRSWKSIM